MENKLLDAAKSAMEIMSLGGLSESEAFKGLRAAISEAEAAPTPPKPWPNPKPDPLEVFSTDALVAIVNRETVIGKNDLAQYGHLQSDPVTPAYTELSRRLDSSRHPDPAPSRADAPATPVTVDDVSECVDEIERRIVADRMFDALEMVKILRGRLKCSASPAPATPVTVEGVKRYEPGYGEVMYEQKGGEWVRYADILSRLQSAGLAGEEVGYAPCINHSWNKEGYGNDCIHGPGRVCKNKSCNIQINRVESK